MGVPDELIQRARNARCIAYCDDQKVARTIPFGLLRPRILAAGELFLFVDERDPKPLIALGLERAKGTRKGVWRVIIKSAEDLDALAKMVRRLPHSRILRCCMLAIPVSCAELHEVASLFSSGGTINNPLAGCGRSAARFQRIVEKNAPDLALLTFHVDSDVVRLYFSDAMVEQVLHSFEYRNLPLIPDT